MSATQVKSALAIAILIALIGPGGAQEASASLESANIAGAGTSPSLSENSWDFTQPDSIPGFGPLPQNYDVRTILPKFSGE
jgi:hypothetical protein